jgi:sec-independent protein translocase protein TatB
MSFSETIFLFFLALIIFGPKKLPEMAKQAGRLLAELRRASNEFRSQIESEIAHLEVEKQQSAPPPSQTPPGTVASMSLNADGEETVPPVVEGAASLAGPVEATPAAGSPAGDWSTSSLTPSEGTSTGTAAEAQSEPAVSRAQDANV